MEKIVGKVIYEGVTHGPIHILEKEDFKIQRVSIDNPEEEIKRLHLAKDKALEELDTLYNKSLETVGEETAAIFEVHKMMLEDEDYLESIENIIKVEKVNAEYAVVGTREEFANMFASMEDAYMKAREADVRDISNRLIRCLYGHKGVDNTLLVPSIIVADDLTPSDTVKLEKSKILAFVTARGSRNSHTAILARTMNIPALTHVKMDLLNIHSGMEAIVDGTTGEFIIDPTDEQVARVEEMMNTNLKKQQELQSLMELEDVTKSGKKVNLYANIGNSEDLDYALANGARGIGLFRTEFLYIGKDRLPDEEEQFQIYKDVASRLEGRKLIIRTLDIGADKKADYLDLGEEENPALGYRAIRICLTRPEIFKAQLRAIYRAAVYGNISIMYPMIISVEEVLKIKEICKEVKEELASKNIPYADVEEGIMIETPAAVMISDELAKLVDFFSVGTNDLTQYTLAIDRQNEKLDSFYNSHHKALLRMIRMAADNIHREGKWIGICGELGADTELTQEFMDMGIDELSVVPGAVLSVRKAIRESL